MAGAETVGRARRPGVKMDRSIMGKFLWRVVGSVSGPEARSAL